MKRRRGDSGTRGALGKLDDRLQASKIPTVDRPERKTFEAFLREDAMVPTGGGEYARFSFEGREILLAVVRVIDRILGGEDSEPLRDSMMAIAGGAQFGKTTIELLLGAYLTSQRFLNFGLYMPDDDIAARVIDTKFRPDVVDQIPWLARMTQCGRAVNASGKAVNTKKAAAITDGVRRANFLVSGLQKPATTFSLDVAARDEEDDIPPKNAKFVRGRMTASKYRIQFVIGTQRVHGRGQNKAWEDASQGVALFGPMSEAWQFEPAEEVGEIPTGFLNVEDEFPGVIRCAVNGVPSPSDPKLTWAGDFRHDAAPNDSVYAHRPSNFYYLAHPETGEPLDRLRPVLFHRKPERIDQHQWGVRISQLGIGAIGLSQILGQFQLAVNDPDEMIVFRCDVLALPQSTSQAITPAILDRAQNVDPFEMRIVREPSRVAIAGLDMGDKCWLTVREIENPECKRLIYAASVTSGDVARRIAGLHAQNLFDCLFVDQRPLVDKSREIALHLNGLNVLTTWPTAPKKGDKDGHISFESGLTWDGRNAQWRNLKCAVVRFDKKKIGMGIEHDFDRFEEGGFEKFVPLISCNREETIDRAVRAYLTPEEGVNEVVGGKIRILPSMLLPIGSQPIIETLRQHIVSGSERERGDDGSLGDYKDKIANHLLLADAYASLAEIIGEIKRSGGSISAAALCQIRIGGSVAGRPQFQPRRLV